MYLVRGREFKFPLDARVDVYMLQSYIISYLKKKENEYYLYIMLLLGNEVLDVVLYIIS